MKKRFSLFITLALTTFLASGCSLQDIFSEKEQDDTEQKGDSEQGEKSNKKKKQILMFRLMRMAEAAKWPLQ